MGIKNKNGAGVIRSAAAVERVERYRAAGTPVMTEVSLLDTSSCRHHIAQKDPEPS